jgi:PUA-domain protein
MSQKYRRYSLKSKEAKQVLVDGSQKLKIDLESIFGSKANVEIVEADSVELLLLGGKPLLFRTADSVLPTLLAAELITKLPKAVVDMGAVKFVCNGADIMSPGIVRYEGDFQKGDVIVIVDVTHGKPLAIGETLYNSEDARKTKKGAAIKNLHYVGDKVWNAAKPLTQ